LGRKGLTNKQYGAMIHTSTEKSAEKEFVRFGQQVEKSSWQLVDLVLWYVHRLRKRQKH